MKGVIKHSHACPHEVVMGVYMHFVEKIHIFNTSSYKQIVKNMALVSSKLLSSERLD